jgi:ABC-type molybdate transport system substrate-binding protein
MRRMRAIAAVAALILTGIASASGQEHSKGWWVILGSFPTEPWMRQTDDSARMETAAARCGVRIFNDLSSKFRGFRAGYNVFVTGAFASRAQAEGVARAARRCFAGAYVKYGEHLGE